MKSSKEFIKINNRLHEITIIKDLSGNILQQVIKPTMIHFYGHDFFQVIVGATLLAIPVAYTEETWNLGGQLPVYNVICIAILSLIFISFFIYFHSYKNQLRKHYLEFLLRVFLTYILSAAVVTLLLLLINKAPFNTAEYITTIKRIIIISLPASMSAAVTDMIK